MCGKVTTDFAGSADSANAVALQPDGKVVAVGGTSSTLGFAVARYNPDGSLDPTFGTGGKVTTNFTDDSLAWAVVVQPDGKVVAVGDVREKFALARYNPDGSLDPTFGTGGKVVTANPESISFFNQLQAVALQPDGKLVAAGQMARHTGDIDFVLLRYNPDGSLDPTFGGLGIVATDFAGFDAAQAVVLQPDGKLVAVGGASFNTSNGDFALARYNPDGSLDPTFGTGGRVTTDFAAGQDVARAAVLQPDGKLVAAGVASYSSALCELGSQGSACDFALARYNPDGSLDPTFGTGGKVTTDFTGTYNKVFAVALQPDGKIVAVGDLRVGGNNFDFALARYNPDGTLDPTFGAGGQVTTDFAGGEDVASGVALQPDGKLVAVGHATIGGQSDFALVRYLP